MVPSPCSSLLLVPAAAAVWKMQLAAVQADAEVMLPSSSIATLLSLVLFCAAPCSLAPQAHRRSSLCPHRVRADLCTSIRRAQPFLLLARPALCPAMEIAPGSDPALGSFFSLPMAGLGILLASSWSDSLRPLHPPVPARDALCLLAMAVVRRARCSLVLAALLCRLLMCAPSRIAQPSPRRAGLCP
ncbi:uncharacterized protein LOC103646721 [Zea mays]|uniref:uncharacterized protein LOC103646721 n=1 Tax=Zea mays TaxID=4577 RepID=UPI000220FE24|nr:uncharacterized protein LOC103646721 [Zea mays]